MTACNNAPSTTASTSTSTTPATPTSTSTTTATPSSTSTTPSTPTASSPSASYEGAHIKSAKPIGHTSVVFKLTFDDGRVAAFKPESTRGRLRYRSEAAAFRLQDALGIKNVPPAFLVSLPASALRAAGNADAQTLFDAEVKTHDGKVRGALMPWIVGLSFIPLEAEPLRTRWRAWLRARPDGGAPRTDDPQQELAPEISALLVFDMLTGNWDRWSGANVGMDAEKKHLLFVDNDGAFFEPVPQNLVREHLTLVRGADRFPRAVIDAARKLDADALDRTLGLDETGAPLLTKEQRASILSRRDDLLLIVDAKVKSLGEDTVYGF